MADVATWLLSSLSIVAGWGLTEGSSALRGSRERRRQAEASDRQRVDELVTAGIDFARLSASIAEANWQGQVNGVVVDPEQFRATVASLNEAGARVELTAARVALHGPQALKGRAEELTRLSVDVKRALSAANRLSRAVEVAQALEAVTRECETLRLRAHAIIGAYGSK